MSLALWRQLGQKVPEGVPGTLALYERSCEAGHALACFDLAGTLRRGGTGVPADPERADGLGARAVSLMARDCDQGDADACHSLAGRYQSGLHVRQDRERALALFERACDAGSSLACAELQDR
jgi:TPR repeat protein